MKKTKNKLPDNPGKTSSNSKPRKWFYLILILIPVLFFAILELVLRITGYGTDHRLFITYPEYYPDKYFINPEITKKYFTNLKKGPNPVPDGFDIVKKEGTFRVFVLGGSSTAGWPYPPNASFSRHLKRRLDHLYGDKEIEVINCGISAINSYTIRDFLPGILDQKPDLILMYAGHNEYYGALGVASSSSLGRSRILINSYIWLQKFRTVQLTENFLKWIYGLFSEAQADDQPASNETLMSRMIGESLIPYDSDLFHAGLSQYEGNLNDILTMTKKAGVPVVLGTVISNIRDLKPFISVKDDGMFSAEEIFIQASYKLQNGEIEEAKRLFLKAKDFDALRFRAPSEVNKIIKKTAAKFNYALVDLDSLFMQKSPDGIVGYNLTVDHLHPNIEGYRLIGKAFYEMIEKSNLLPSGKRQIDLAVQDSILNENFPFTAVDSVMAHIKLITLIGSYPFTPKGSPNTLLRNFKPTNLADSMALKVIQKEIFWEEAHYEVAKRYYYSGNYDKFLKEMNAVIEERPFNDVTFETTINLLIDANLQERALPYLERLHKLKPSYFTNKWLGQINLAKGNQTKALTHLLDAVKSDEADFQTWYNLAGAYYLNNDVNNALSAVRESLRLNPRYQLAQSFYEQLKTISAN